MKLFNRMWVALATVFMLLSLAGCTKVPAGNVGVLFNLYGEEKGVDAQIVGPGRYWLTPNEELYLFPTFTQTYNWTKEPIDGDPTDESISFQSVEGLVFNADVGISYAIQKDKVTIIFQKYRKGVEEITDIILRNMVRDAIVAASSDMPSESIYGAGRTALISEVQAEVQKQVAPYGIMVEKISWIGQLRLDPKLQAAINAKLEATQIAMQRENEVQTAKAEAAKEVERATGEANAKILVATAEAKAIDLRGEALRNNPALVELVKAEAMKDAVQKWDGQLPTTMPPNGAVPFLNINGK